MRFHCCKSDTWRFISTGSGKFSPEGAMWSMQYSLPMLVQSFLLLSLRFGCSVEVGLFCWYTCFRLANLWESHLQSQVGQFVVGCQRFCNLVCSCIANPIQLQIVNFGWIELNARREWSTAKSNVVNVLFVINACAISFAPSSPIVLSSKSKSLIVEWG